MRVVGSHAEAQLELLLDLAECWEAQHMSERLFPLSTLMSPG